MDNTALAGAFHTWLLASDRRDSTIKLRMRDLHALSETVDLLKVDEVALTEILAARRHLAAETRKSQLASWRLFFRWAHRRGYRADDPTADIPAINVPPPLPRVATDDAIRRAIARANPHHRAMILLARGGWLRLSEIATLHTSNRHGQMLAIVGKGGRHRIVSMNAEVTAALDALEQNRPTGYYFPGARGRAHIHPISVNKIINRLTGFNPHALRHAGATAAWRKTRNLRAIQDMLGHASIKTTQRYVHIDDTDRESVAEASRLYA